MLNYNVVVTVRGTPFMVLTVFDSAPAVDVGLIENIITVLHSSQVTNVETWFPTATVESQEQLVSLGLEPIMSCTSWMNENRFSRSILM